MKIGDKVEVINPNTTAYKWKGEISQIFGDNSIEVKFFVNGIWNFGVFSKSDLKPLIPSPFTIKDLKDGDIVTLRSGAKYIYFEGTFLKFQHKPLYLLPEEYNENMLWNDLNRNFDILTVTRNGEVVFKREETNKNLCEDVYKTFEKHGYKILNTFWDNDIEGNSRLTVVYKK